MLEGGGGGWQPLYSRSHYPLCHILYQSYYQSCPIYYLMYIRTLMEGDEKAGFSIFWADDGLDTGPILLQKETKLDIDDTVDTIYTRFLYPEGIRAMVS